MLWHSIELIVRLLRMNEARIAQYLDLIQRLLGCSGGEQRAILQAQRELWDEESLRTLPVVAG